MTPLMDRRMWNTPCAAQCSRIAWRRRVPSAVRVRRESGGRGARATAMPARHDTGPAVVAILGSHSVRTLPTRSRRERNAPHSVARFA